MRCSEHHGGNMIQLDFQMPHAKAEFQILIESLF